MIDLIMLLLVKLQLVLLSMCDVQFVVVGCYLFLVFIAQKYMYEIPNLNTAAVTGTNQLVFCLFGMLYYCKWNNFGIVCLQNT
jgi:hypothetical protein